MGERKDWERDHAVGRVIQEDGEKKPMAELTDMEVITLTKVGMLWELYPDYAPGVKDG